LATGVPKAQRNRQTPTLDSPNTPLDLSLTYEGKRSISDILLTQPATIHTLWKKSAGPGATTPANQLFYGDNLPILATLLQNPAWAGKVRLIYIDPPFATNSVFQSRTQRDAYNDLLVGAQYVEFLRERLLLLRELLSDDGSIYLHLDANMAFPMKIILDEIFGRSNFRSWITRKKCNPKNFTRKAYGNISDYILFYTRSARYIWNRPFAPWTEEKAAKEYPYLEAETGRRYKKVPLHAPGIRHGATGERWHEKLPPPGKHWQYPPETLDAMNTQGEIYWSARGNPRRKIYLGASAGIPIQDIWLDFKDAHNQNIHVTGYPTEKNPNLLARIIETSSQPGDLVLDCFAGSGTTLAVASQLGRQWIGIDNSPAAIDTILRRFAKGLAPMGDFVRQKVFPAPLTRPDEPVPDTTPAQTIIDDFTLSGSEDFPSELAQTLAQWLEWQKEARQEQAKGRK
jgi:adenine-specific DNA-methyltransferase